MSRRIAVVVLCEDNAHSTLVAEFLRRCGIRGNIRFWISSANWPGAGEQGVRSRFPIEVEAYLRAKAKRATRMIAMIDADTGSVARRQQQLEEPLKAADDHRIRELQLSKEMIAILIPRRNVETWVLALNGVSVNEIDDYKDSRPAPDWFTLTPTAADRLYDWTRRNATFPTDTIDSLRLGIQELARVFPRTE
jgi:hypothetical protein